MPVDRALIERLERLTRETIAPRAAEYDAAGVNPIESWHALHRAENFLAAVVPRKYGGLELDMPTYIAGIRTIARGCSSTAMTVHMHSTVLRFIDALATDAQKRRYFDEVVTHGKLFGSWGSEPAVSLSRNFLMETVVREEDDHYVVDGIKYFCTMALGASYYMVWCSLDGGTDMSKSVLQVVIPAETPGVSTDGKWNTLGMRATFSPSVTLSGVRVPHDTGLGDPGAVLNAGVLESFPLGYSAIYLGCAEASLAFAVDYAKKRIVQPANVAVALDPTVQRHIGELRVHLDSALLMLADCAEKWADADVPGRADLANRAKFLASEVGLMVTSKVIQIVGGRGAYKDFPAERAFRDVRTATLMPPTVDRMLEAMGKNALGIETGIFNVPGTGGVS